MTRTAGLLHTVPSLAATFDAMMSQGDLRRIHVVDGWLLATARRAGVTAAVRDAVAAHVRNLESAGAEAILVTCSSIGEAAEQAAKAARVPVLRVDAPMAAEAVGLAGDAGRIVVLATLSSTLGPTTRLVERAAAGRTVTVTAEVVGGAAAAVDAGDRGRADELIAAAVAEARADVIVLAQASMAGAAAAAAVPVLSSPPGGVRALLDAVS